MNTQTKKLQQEELKKKNNHIADLLLPDTRYFEPSDLGGGVIGYLVDPIETFSPYVVIAPFAPPPVMEGRIIMPDQVQSNPEIGMVVGVWEGDDCPFELGDCVRYSPKNKLCSVSAEYPFYEGAQLHVMRHEAVYSRIPERNWFKAVKAVKANHE